VHEFNIPIATLETIMPKKFALISVVLGSMFFLSANAADETATPATHEIDVDVWNVVVDTVKTHDIIRMGSTYFPDAILVGPKGTKAITKALEKWGRDMIDAQAKGDSATVAFRFSRREDDSETAFESGIFKYTEIEKSGSTASAYIPFEQLLLKKNGKWRILMERQLPDVTQGDWDKLPRQ